MANSYTPGLKLRKPAQGDDLWDDDLNANADALEAALGAGSFSYVIGTGLAVSSGGGLSAAYTAGSCRVNGTKYTLAAGSVTVANALNFVFVSSAGVVTAATALPSPPYTALALVEASGGAIVRIGDLRVVNFDALGEHLEGGKHTAIQPTTVTPSGTTGAYKRSACAAYQSPESQVNNLILKLDSSPLISLSGKTNGYTQEFTAAELGSGYIPADANGVMALAQLMNTTGGTYARWYVYPTGVTDDNQKGAAELYVNDPESRNVYVKGLLIFKLSSTGKFTVELMTNGGGTAGLLMNLVGWIEPA